MGVHKDGWVKRWVGIKMGGYKDGCAHTYADVCIIYGTALAFGTCD